MVVTGDIHLKEDIPMVEKDEAHTAPEEKDNQEAIIHPVLIHLVKKDSIADQAIEVLMVVEEAIQAAGEAIVLAESLGN